MSAIKSRERFICCKCVAGWLTAASYIIKHLDSSRSRQLTEELFQIKSQALVETMLAFVFVTAGAADCSVPIQSGGKADEWI